MAWTITYAAARLIADQASDQAPREACGLLAGRENRITRAYPLPNAAKDAERAFQLEPSAQLLALKRIEADKLEWLGAYHSHPQSPPLPSPVDIRDQADAGLLQLIVSLERGQPRLKLWRIEGRSATPLELAFEGAEQTVPGDELQIRQRAAIATVGIAAALILLLVAFALLPPAPAPPPPP